eukprot:5706996-Amphidinium_carterae.1
MDQVDQLPSTRTLLMFCKSGKHRSVTMAEYVGWALGIDIHHLCSSHWPPACNGQCEKCCVSDRNRLKLSSIFTQNF